MQNIDTEPSLTYFIVLLLFATLTGCANIVDNTEMAIITDDIKVGDSLTFGKYSENKLLRRVLAVEDSRVRV